MSAGMAVLGPWYRTWSRANLEERGLVFGARVRPARPSAGRGFVLGYARATEDEVWALVVRWDRARVGGIWRDSFETPSSVVPS